MYIWQNAWSAAFRASRVIIAAEHTVQLPQYCIARIMGIMWMRKECAKIYAYRISTDLPFCSLVGPEMSHP